MPGNRLPFDIVPIGDWPARHRERFEAALIGGGLLDDGGVFADLPLWHQHKIRSAWGRWLGYLATEHDGNQDAATFTKDALAGFLGHLQAHLAPATVWAHVRNLWLAAKAVEPDADLTKLVALKNALARNREPRPRQHKLVPAQDLYELGLSLMVESEAIKDQLTTAAEYRDGLAIALLAARPFRLGNFTAIEIGHHLLRHGAGYVIQFAGREAKNGKAIAAPVPRELAAFLDRYIDELRPVLLAHRRQTSGDPGARLWISEHGSAIHPKTLSRRIGEITLAHLGIAISPHFFRNIAATSIAVEDPAHVGIVTAILGHRSITTAARYYNLATSLHAARRWEHAMSRAKGKEK